MWILSNFSSMKIPFRLDFNTGWGPQPKVGFTPTKPQEGQQRRELVGISFWKSLFLFSFSNLYIVIVFIVFEYDCTSNLQGLHCLFSFSFCLTPQQSMSTKPEIKLMSLNVNGLGNPVKRARVITKLRKEKTQINFLQETHLSRSEHEKLKKFGY